MAREHALDQHHIEFDRMEHPPAYGEADVLARKVLKHGKMIFRNHYRYHGTTYRIIDGKVLPRDEGERLSDQMRWEGRNPR